MSVSVLCDDVLVQVFSHLDDKCSVRSLLLALGTWAKIPRNANTVFVSWFRIHGQAFLRSKPCCFRNGNDFHATKASKASGMFRDLHVKEKNPREWIIRYVAGRAGRGGALLDDDDERLICLVAFLHPEWLDENTVDAVLYTRYCETKAEDYDGCKWVYVIEVTDSMIRHIMRALPHTCRLRVMERATTDESYSRVFRTYYNFPLFGYYERLLAASSDMFAPTAIERTLREVKAWPQHWSWFFHGLFDTFQNEFGERLEKWKPRIVGDTFPDPGFMDAKDIRMRHPWLLCVLKHRHIDNLKVVRNRALYAAVAQDPDGSRFQKEVAAWQGMQREDDGSVLT